jgi:PAS domain S-box-containing protein
MRPSANQPPLFPAGNSLNLTQFNRILIQILLTPVLALAVLAAILVWQIRSSQNTAARVQATGDIIAACSNAEKLMVDQETGLRGFQITGDEKFLQPYRDANAPLEDALNNLQRALEAQHEAPDVVDAVRSAHTTWQTSYALPLIATTRAGGNTYDPALNMTGKLQMDAVRARLADLLDREANLRRGQLVHWRSQSRHIIEGLILLALLVGVAISVFTVSRLHTVSDVFEGTLEGLRRHAQATYESEERLRTTLTSIGDGVIVCDPDGNIELVNTVAQNLTGWTQADAFHRPLSDVFHIVNEDTRELVETPVDKVKRLKRVVGLANHTVLLRRDGSEIQIDDSGAPIYNRAGDLSGIVMVFRDITEQRRTQSVLLATEKLAVAGRLAATIAHEMHNPLDSVANLLYLIKNEQDPATSAHYLQMAEGELARMGQISRAMLGLYRESKMPVPIDVKEMLQSVLVLLEGQTRQAQVSVTTSLPEGLEVEGFPAELRQVFTNLFANALDAVDMGGHIHVTATASNPTSPTRNGVLIHIQDDGSGIAPDALAHIFEPFFTTKGERGTGLGLWVSRGIVDKHGGSITVRSESNPSDSEAHGTTIEVFLPRLSAAKTPSLT